MTISKIAGISALTGLSSGDGISPERGISQVGAAPPTPPGLTYPLDNTTGPLVGASAWPTFGPELQSGSFTIGASAAGYSAYPTLSLGPPPSIGGIIPTVAGRVIYFELGVTVPANAGSSNQFFAGVLLMDPASFSESHIRVTDGSGSNKYLELGGASSYTYSTALPSGALTDYRIGIYLNCSAKKFGAIGDSDFGLNSAAVMSSATSGLVLGITGSQSATPSESGTVGVQLYVDPADFQRTPPVGSYDISGNPIPGFSVLELFANSEVGAWFDPSDFSTMFQDSAGTTPVTAVGQSVGLILDKSGNGKHASQSTSSKRPTLGIDANDRYYLQFNGTSNAMATASIDFSGTDKMSIFSGAAKLDNTGRIVCELSSNVNANTGTFYFIAGDDPGAPGRGYTSLSRGTASPSLTQRAYFTNSGSDTAVVTATHDISGDLSRVRRNQAVGTNATGDKGSGNFGNYPIYIGARGGTSVFFNGKLYQLIVRGAASTAGEIASAESYVNSKTTAY